jgi:hypothetical protein
VLDTVVYALAAAYSVQMERPGYFDATEVAAVEAVTASSSALVPGPVADTAPRRRV